MLPVLLPTGLAMGAGYPPNAPSQTPPETGTGISAVSFPAFGIVSGPSVYQEHAFPQNTSRRCLNHKTPLSQIRHHPCTDPSDNPVSLAICLYVLLMFVLSCNRNNTNLISDFCIVVIFLTVFKILNITIFLNTTPQKYNIINIFPNILTAAINM